MLVVVLIVTKEGRPQEGEGGGEGGNGEGLGVVRGEGTRLQTRLGLHWSVNKSYKE